MYRDAYDVAGVEFVDARVDELVDVIMMTRYQSRMGVVLKPRGRAL